MRVKLIASVTVALLIAPPSLAAHTRWLIPPVDAPIRRGFDLPEGIYGPGNRGIDYAAHPGRGVRAAGDGVVSFAGPVAGRLAVTIDHGEGMETTYTGLREVHVETGGLVTQGAWIGEVGDRGLHFGVLVRDVYVDPADHLGPVDQTDAIHLVPVRSRSDDATRRCTPRVELQELRHTRAPSNNVAVVVAGINDSWSRDRRPRAFDVPAALGYERVAYFSYSGRADGYSKADTRGDIRVAALRLEALMERVARRYPHAEVDLVAHSQGGLVARRYLEGTRSAWDRPRVDHLVTFATPHQGARLAGELAEVERDTITGGAWLDSISEGRLPREVDWGLRLQHEPVRRALSDGVAWAHRALPDPRAVSLGQMAPGSDFLADLAAEDVVYGTRVLALQDRLDLMVPATHARYPGKINRATDDGWWHARHTEILDSSEALAMAHAFLRDAPPPCLTATDFERWRAGSWVSATERLLDEIAALGEEALIGRLLGPGGPGAIRAARQGVRLVRTGGVGALNGWIRDGVARAARVAGDPDAAAGWARRQLIEQFKQEAVRGVLKWGFERRAGK